MNDNLPPLPTPEAWRTHVGPWDCSTAYAYTVNQMRAHAAQAVAERDAEIASLREANERFGQRQEWWTEQMFALEQERDALKADAEKHYAAGRVAEREACADICDQHASVEGIAQRCAAAIRARGQKESPPV